MDEGREFPYRAEYAKSGRASCKKCKSPIAKDTLRLAVMVQSPMFDGKVPNWYHMTCFFLLQKPSSVEDIGHFGNLRWDDQEKIRKKLEAASQITNGKGKSKKGTIKGKSDFSVEMAKSGRAACKDCEEKILKGEVRISKMDYESEKAKRFGPIPRWHHVECFVKCRTELEFFDKGDTLPGFFTLGEEEKKVVREKIPEINVKRKIELEEPQPTKKIKKENSEMKKQNEKLFYYRDILTRSLKKKDMVTLLEYNNAYIPKGESKVLDHLADLMTFGSLAKCKICRDGGFIYSYGSGYVCTGDISEFTKCSNVMECPTRQPFKIPEEIREKIPFLSKYKYKNRGARLVCKIASKAIVNESTQVHEKEQPLRDLKFVLEGNNFSMNVHELEQKIRDLGGSVKARVVNDLAAVVTTKGSLNNESNVIKDAQSKGIQCVPEDFLNEIQQGNALFMIKKMNMAPWGSDITTRLAGEENKRKSKAGSMFMKSMPEKQKIKLKDGVAVDPDSELQDHCHVYRRGSKIYNSILNYVDIAKGANSYYKLQVLESDNKRKWYVFRSWGRIGTTIGSHKLETMSDLHDAIGHFENLYLEKTANKFGAKEFIKVAGGWYPLELDYEQTKDKTIDLSKSKSKLEKPIQEFVATIFDVGKMKSTLIEYELDLKKMPLGRISKRQIEKAFKVLSEAKCHIDKLDSKEDVKFDTQSLTAIRGHILDCSNKFYTLIPHDFGLKVPPLLDTADKVKAKLDMLDSMKEIEIAYNLLQSDDSETKGMEPIDRYYKKLKTDMEVLDKTSDEFDMIKRYVQNTHAATHSHYTLELEQVFKIDRKGEKKRYKPFKKLHNKQLLWHGSRTTNYAGILSQGLRIAPPEAPVTGYMFGKGIYFADMVSKSANYCCTTTSNSKGFLLLCDVALGNMYEKRVADFITELPPGKHSAKGIGKTCPDPSSDVITEYGVKVPLGKPVELDVGDTSLLYNEYIVYDVAQLCTKYLLQVNFNYVV